MEHRTKHAFSRLELISGTASYQRMFSRMLMYSFSGNALRKVDTRSAPAIQLLKGDSVFFLSRNDCVGWKSLSTRRKHSLQHCAEQNQLKKLEKNQLTKIFPILSRVCSTISILVCMIFAHTDLRYANRNTKIEIQ